MRDDAGEARRRPSTGRRRSARGRNGLRDARGRRGPSAQRGTSLLEALVAFLVLSAGVLATGHLQAHLRLASDIARQRAEAVRLGQEDLEGVRAFAVMAASAGLRAYESIDDHVTSFEAGGAYATPTRFEVRRDVDAAAFAGAKATRVRVGWNDRRGQAQQVELASVVAAQDPVYSAALVLGAAAPARRGPRGRAAAIPVAAHDLGNGRSAWRPTPSAALVLLFDNATGALVERCAAPAVPGTTMAALATTSTTATSTTTTGVAPAMPTDCGAEAGSIVTGTVRFAFDATSASAPPSTSPSLPTPIPTSTSSAAITTEPPLPLTIVLTTTGGPYPAPPTCTSEALKTVRFTAADGPHVEPAPLAATPASMGLAEWVETGERYVAYTCIVHPGADGRWSGRTTVVPAGWRIGNGVGDRRVCRYSTDLDGSGAVDAAFEHPADYRAVDSALANQNFLVLPATLDCPSTTATSTDAMDGGAADAGATVAHQP